MPKNNGGFETIKWAKRCNDCMLLRLCNVQKQIQELKQKLMHYRKSSKATECNYIGLHLHCFCSYLLLSSFLQILDEPWYVSDELMEKLRMLYTTTTKICLITN